jgi:hypothetical protein
MNYIIQLRNEPAKVLGYVGPDSLPTATFDTPDNLASVCRYSTVEYAVTSLGILFNGIPDDVFKVVPEPTPQEFIICLNVPCNSCDSVVYAVTNPYYKDVTLVPLLDDSTVEDQRITTVPRRSIVSVLTWSHIPVGCYARPVRTTGTAK